MHQESQARYLYYIQGLSNETIQVLNNNFLDVPDANGSSIPNMHINDNAGEWEDIAEDVIGTVPTGDEGESIYYDLCNILTRQCIRLFLCNLESLHILLSDGNHIGTKTIRHENHINIPSIVIGTLFSCL
ncbi:hypothetical protein C0989_000992 [Termitomyces sp. Mn162]|nr:hypothetical protein C0989_000992 [Termitomyces sp. Mn162]